MLYVMLGGVAVRLSYRSFTAVRSAVRSGGLTPRWPIALALAGALTVAGCGARQPSESRLVAEGRRVFITAGCGSCHMVASADTHGRLGPDFDTSEQLTRGQIRRQLDIGEGGMPSFRDRLTARQERAVTEFVFETMHDRRG